MDLLMFAVAAMVLTYSWRLHDVFVALRPLKLLTVISVIAPMAWLFAGGRRRRLGELRTPIPKLVLALTLVAILGVPFSVWPGGSFRFLWNDFSKTILFFLLVAASVRHFKDVERLTLTYLAGALVFSMLALTRLQGSPDGRMPGLVYYDANDLAAVLILAVPMAVYYMRNGVRPDLRIAAAASLALFTFVLMRTVSRGGFLAFLATMIYIVLRFHAIPRRHRVAAMALGAGTLLLLATEPFWEQMSTLLNPAEDYNVQNEASGRLGIWKRGLGYVARRPILGVGIDQFGTAEGVLSEVAAHRLAMGLGFKWSAPHNSFVQVAAELGLSGLLCFLGAIYLSIKSLAGLWRHPLVPGGRASAEAAMGQTLIGAFVAYLVGGFFVSHAYYPHAYFLLGLAAAMWKLYPPTGKPGPRAPVRARRPRARTTRQPPAGLANAPSR